MINQVNLNLKEKDFHLELNGCILELVKGDDRYCLLVESDRHVMFTFLMHIDDFIYVFVSLKERG
jgi:hypothetical protein